MGTATNLLVFFFLISSVRSKMSDTKTHSILLRTLAMPNFPILFTLLANCRNVIMSLVCSFFYFTHLNEEMHTITLLSMKKNSFLLLIIIRLIFELRFFEGFSREIQSVYKKTHWHAQ